MFTVTPALWKKDNKYIVFHFKFPVNCSLSVKSICTLTNGALIRTSSVWGSLH